MFEERQPQFQVGRDRGCMIVTAMGPEIPIAAKDELYALAAPEQLEPRQVVLNLERVINFQSAILGILIRFQQKIQEAGGIVKVVCPDASIRLMFRITKVDQVLHLHEHEQLAINAFHETPPLKTP
jgi:anti-anti-sigma factor